MSNHLHPVSDVALGLALEAEAFAAQSAAICLWTARQRAIVCPASMRRRPGFDRATARSAGRGWPVNLRPTGGGPVPQGPGVLNLALAFTVDRRFAIEDGYRLITSVIREAAQIRDIDLVTGATPDSFCDGAWNLSISGRKFVGTAQRLRPLGNGQRRVLAHALILMEGDVGAGARAVDAFHRDLGLSPIRIDAHTTLAQATGAEAPDTDGLASALHAAASRALAGVVARAPQTPARPDTQPPVGGGRHPTWEEHHVQ